MQMTPQRSNVIYRRFGSVRLMCHISKLIFAIVVVTFGTVGSDA